MIFAPIQTREDELHGLAIRNAVVRQRPLTKDEWLTRGRFIPERAEHEAWTWRDRAYMSLSWNTWAEKPGRLEGNLMALDDEAFEIALEHLMARSDERRRRLLSVWNFAAPPGAPEALAARGFTSTQRNIESTLDLRARSADEDQRLVDRLRRGEIELISLAQAVERFSEDWDRRCWRLEMDLFQDVPLPEPFQEQPFDEFAKQLYDPLLDRSMVCIAVAGGEYIGTSQVFPNRANLTLADTGLTGVLRKYRRHGVASAMKAQTFLWARDRGISTVSTDNEEGNPMWDLNWHLGFRPAFEWKCYELAIGPGECETPTSSSGGHQVVGKGLPVEAEGHASACLGTNNDNREA